MVPSSVIKGMFATFVSPTLLSQPRLVLLHKGRRDLLALFGSLAGLLSSPSLLPTYHDVIQGRAWHQCRRARLGAANSIWILPSRFSLTRGWFQRRTRLIWGNMEGVARSVWGRSQGKNQLGHQGSLLGTTQSLIYIGRMFDLRTSRRFGAARCFHQWPLIKSSHWLAGSLIQTMQPLFGCIRTWFILCSHNLAGAMTRFTCMFSICQQARRFRGQLGARGNVNTSEGNLARARGQGNRCWSEQACGAK